MTSKRQTVAFAKFFKHLGTNHCLWIVRFEMDVEKKKRHIHSVRNIQFFLPSTSRFVKEIFGNVGSEGRTLF